MPLTATTIKSAKPGPKQRKLSDAKGLYLLVHPNGSKYWRWSYRYQGKQKTLALGVYPDVSFKQARQRRDDGRALVADGVDPAQARRVEQAAKLVLNGSNKEQSVRLSLEELITAITGDELNDGANVVRATLEDDTLQNVTSVTEDENPQQFVYEGLCHFDISEVNHHHAATTQHFFGLLTYWNCGRARTNHAPMRIGFQGQLGPMFSGLHTYMIAH